MKNYILLTRNQWIGILILLTLLAGIFVGLHFLPQPEPTAELPDADTIQKEIKSNKKAYYDSLRRIRTARYDSLRLVRRDSLHQVYQAHRDSMKQADSLWWDSVYSSTPRAIKIDTILELNSADTTELKLIRGIGSSMAKRIVKYRERLGGYSDVRQLLDDELYMDQYGHSIRSRYSLSDSILPAFTVCIDSIRPIAVNHASVERLQAHPYISHSLAKEIYTLRREQVKIKNIDELRVLPHMNDSLIQRLAPYLEF